MMVPTVPETNTAKNPTVTEIRAPNIRRLNMSRPRWSVPKGWLPQLGAIKMLVESTLIGSNGATIGAKIAQATATLR